MTERRLTAVDAQTYWMSGAVPSDQFLLYAFGDRTTDLDDALEEIRARARMCADLGVRIDESGFWSYPVWARREVGPDQFVVHDIADATWAGCLNAVTAMVDEQLDARVLTWRLHVFPGLEGLPAETHSGTVAVLQICHALGDGVLASALAAQLFGRAGGLPAVTPVRTPPAAPAGAGLACGANASPADA